MYLPFQRLIFSNLAGFAKSAQPLCTAGTNRTPQPISAARLSLRATRARASRTECAVGAVLAPVPPCRSFEGTSSTRSTHPRVRLFACAAWNTFLLRKLHIPSGRLASHPCGSAQLHVQRRTIVQHCTPKHTGERFIVKEKSTTSKCAYSRSRPRFL